MFLDLVTEPRLQLLFPKVILILEPFNGHVLLHDLLLEQLYSFLVSLSSCFLAVGEVLVLIPELLHLFVQLILLLLGLISLLNSSCDHLRHSLSDRCHLAQFYCLLHQLLRPLDVAGVGILAKVESLPDLDALVVQVGVDLIFD